MKRSVYIASPVLGGFVPINYSHCIWAMFEELTKAGMGAHVDNAVGHSHIGRGRNSQLHDFLCSNHTHFFCFDSDEALNPPRAVVELVNLDLPIVGIPYATKYSVPFPKIAEAARARLVPDEKLGAIGKRYAYKELPHGFQSDERGVGEVELLGTGCMMVKREVIEAMCDEYADRWFLYSDSRGTQAVPWLFHDHLTEDRQLYSEDYGFCYLWRKMGGKIYAWTGANVSHFGFFDYGGDFDMHIRAERVARGAE